MKFKTPYSKSERFFTSVGSPIKLIYKLASDDIGKLDLIEAGKENLYEYIQSHADSCDIHVILDRFCNNQEALNERLQRANGTYCDLSNMPTTFAEVLQKVIDGENYFNELPVDIKSKFNFSAAEFVAAIGTPKYFDILGVKPTEQKVEVEDEQKPEQ